MRSNVAMRVYMAAMAFAAWFALLLQFYLTLTVVQATGTSMVFRIANYFSYFTILTNLLIALGLTFSLLTPNSKWGEFFSRPVVRSGLAVYIVMVGVPYSLLLRHRWDPEGLQKAADVILHDLMPILYVVFWLVFVPKGLLRWKDAFLWLCYPLAYMAWVLVHGAASGFYPYHFVDVNEIGYPRMLANAAMLLAACWFAGLLAVAIGRWMERSSRTAHQF